jgi:UDP-2,3-diacylglucosamine pyrophosphatase LpxH
VVVRNARLIAYLGDWAYDTAIAVNVVFNKLRRALGFPYWSLSSWAKLKVKNAVNFIGAFETLLAEEAVRHGCEGIICGHIHHAQIGQRGGIEYINTGDWVESCTAVGERHDGSFELIHWTSAASAAHAEVEALADSLAAMPTILPERHKPAVEAA